MSSPQTLTRPRRLARRLIPPALHLIAFEPGQPTARGGDMDDYEHVPLPALPTPLLEIGVLGGFRLSREGEELTRPGGRPGVLVKALAVLGPLHVEQLADLLWPGIDALTGRRRLRNVLRRAREVLGDLLLREEAVVRLHPDVQVDAVVFDAEVRRALALPAGAPWRGELARRALDRYRGPLLPGDRYEDWSVPPRERLADAAALAWDLLAGEAARAGHPAQAAAHLEEALAIYPHDDERRQRVADLHVAAGQPAEALRHLEDAPPPGLLLPDGLVSS